jgi:hypothetical protein
MSDKSNQNLAQTAAAPLAKSAAADIASFVEKARKVSLKADSGRLVFSLDATMSRQPTWDMACGIQGKMFDAVRDLKGTTSNALSIQLVYFRGHGECRASRFVVNTASLADLMSSISCRAGHTQIGKVLSHCLKENNAKRVSAVIYIGDAFEEDVDSVGQKAGELGVRGVPLFIFQEGHDQRAETAFKEFARLSRGCWFRFDKAAPRTLAELLGAIAVFATGGTDALRLSGKRPDLLLLEQMGRR